MRKPLEADKLETLLNDFQIAMSDSAMTARSVSDLLDEVISFMTENPDIDTLLKKLSLCRASLWGIEAKLEKQADALNEIL